MPTLRPLLPPPLELELELELAEPLPLDEEPLLPELPHAASVSAVADTTAATFIA
jgi:hypothetical protein